MELSSCTNAHHPMLSILILCGVRCEGASVRSVLRTNTHGMNTADEEEKKNESPSAHKTKSR